MDRTLEHALTAAQRGDWHLAHRIVQERNDPLACWLHAILHKVEGDVWNSRYWYARTTHRYEDFTDPQEEFAALRRELEAGGET